MHHGAYQEGQAAHYLGLDRHEANPYNKAIKASNGKYPSIWDELSSDWESGFIWATGKE